MNFVSNVLDLELLAEDEFSLLAFLQETGLVLKEYKCPKCDRACHIIKKYSTFYFACYRMLNKIKCKFYRSLNKDTFFSKVKLSYVTVLKLIYLFSNNIPVTYSAQLVSVSIKTAIDFYSFCRQVCIESMISKKNEQIGGPGCFVEIDKSKFGRKKYIKGRLVDGKWVFGGIQRGSGAIFFEVVEDRSEETLHNLIKKHIKVGTTIISDGWKAYSGLIEDGYFHQVVNNTENFVDPLSGAHTNTIEGTWWNVKRSIPSSGRKAQHFEGYLAHFLWRHYYQKNQKEFFAAFIEDLITTSCL